MKRFFERAYWALVLGATFVLEAHPRNSHIKARKLLHPMLHEMRRYVRYSPSVLRQYYILLDSSPVILAKVSSNWRV
ncbi:hypothetical protein BGY98DRAFT_376401 [Russula aff. rugulosa BPL654]|nr:hypothetical protein BGY98DRAFT_376401 [Russula aff. rugulosa BPL654]